MSRVFKFKRRRKPAGLYRSPTGGPSSSDSTAPVKPGTESIEPYISAYEADATEMRRIQSSSSGVSTVHVDAYEGNSPYVEVRASVPNYDDEAMLQISARMWIIGFGLISGATIMNTLFFTHDPPFIVSPYLVIVLAWPLGWIWQSIVPNIWNLNPGPFTMKEHALISVLASASTMSLNSDTVVSMTYFQNHNPLGSNMIFITLMNWGATIMGMAVAGPLKVLLVDPPAMVWPSQLVTVTLLSSIHLKWNHVANGWRITRKKLFAFATITCGIWSFFVQFFMRFLRRFSFGCWISPNNYVVNQLFGTVTGAGLFPITLDWDVASGYTPSPLVPPARVFANAGLALVIVVWIIASGIHYSDVWWGRHVPFSDSALYDRFGKHYNIFAIIKDRLDLDPVLYERYSPVFMSTVRLVKFGMGLAASISILIQTMLFDRSRLCSYLRKCPADIHNILMRNYKPTPIWWYGVLFLAGLAIMFTSVCAFETHVKAWYPVVALGIVLIYVVPMATVSASTAINVNVGSLVLLMTGYMDPGNAVAMMMFKHWTSGVLEAAVEYVALLKLGQYTKISPRLVFVVRLVGVLWAGVLQMLVLTRIKPTDTYGCDETGRDHLSCFESHAFLTESILWGIVGCKRILQQYGAILHFLWIGVALPVASWFWLKKWPRSKMKVVHWPIFFYAIDKIPPASPYNYTCWVLVGIIFSQWIRRYWHSWWAKYCYTLSAALDFGLAAAELAVFITFLGSGSFGPVWWGNDGFRNNIDGRKEPMIPMKQGQTFGPTSWH